MLSRLHLEHILFLDIETVPETESFVDLDDTKQQLWELKSQYQRKDDYTAEEFYDRAGIWAEFGKIICISVGYFSFKGEQRNFRVTSFYTTFWEVGTAWQLKTRFCATSFSSRA